MGFLFGSGEQAPPSAPSSMSEAVMGFPSVPMGGGFVQPRGSEALPQPKPSHRGGVKNFLGHLGDALLMASGRAPMYGPMLQQREALERQQRAGQALANVLGRLDPSLSELVANDPGTGLEIYKLLHPQARAENKPSFVQEYEYREQLDPEHRKSYDAYARERRFNPFAAPITLGPGDTYDDGSGGQPSGEQEITATGPNGEKVRLNRTTGQWEPVGGPAAGQPGGFL